MCRFNTLPLGLSMAFLENPEAARYFSSCSEQEQKEIRSRARQLNSREEINRYVQHLSALEKGAQG